MRLVSLAALLAAATPVLAQSAIQPVLPSPSKTAQGDVSVTIYNNDRALVEDRRTLDLPNGRTRQEFRDVSARIEPETVTLSGRGIGVVEQNFDFDLLSPQALMQKAVGQTVTLVRVNPATGAEVRERALVLAANGGVVMQIGNRIEVLRDDGLPTRVIFDSVPPTLRPRPTLSVTLESSGAGARPVTLTYLTPGLGWSADYVALYDDANGRMDVQGWITLTNSSGTPYINAKTMLVAGDVGQQRSNYGGNYRRPAPPGLVRAGAQTSNRERLGDFYLYPLPERTTIADRQTKQVSFLDVHDTPVQRAYEFYSGWLQTANEPQSASTVLRFSSAREQGLGDALPAGTIRFYQRDARGNPQFIGEQAIGHTPMGSDVSLATGQAFDVKVRPIVDSRQSITYEQWKMSERFRIRSPDGITYVEVEQPEKRSYFRTKVRYLVTNASPKPVTVDVHQPVQSWDSRITEESIKSERPSAEEVVWHVSVPANGETVLSATFETPY